ncbi:MAG: hypothetical protein M1409_02640, partial [Actinobacteria bacterium]|nr:hypothetical protein [Actinomycetota bacterium]
YKKGVKEMAELTEEELKSSRKILQGVITLLWVVAILTGIGFLTFSANQAGNVFHGFPFNWGSISIGFPGPNFSLVVLAVYVVELVGIHMRKAFAIPLGRAALVVTMVVYFPVGTIFGAILWKRINDPLAKKYLNYEVK